MRVKWHKLKRTLSVGLFKSEKKKRLSYKIIALVLSYPLVKSYGKLYKGVDGHMVKFFGENYNNPK